MTTRLTSERYHKPDGTQRDISLSLTHTHTHTQEETGCSCVGNEQAEPQALTLTRCRVLCLVSGCLAISTVRQKLLATDHIDILRCKSVYCKLQNKSVRSVNSPSTTQH